MDRRGNFWQQSIILQAFYTHILAQHKAPRMMDAYLAAP